MPECCPHWWGGPIGSIFFLLWKETLDIKWIRSWDWGFLDSRKLYKLRSGCWNSIHVWKKKRISQRHNMLACYVFVYNFFSSYVASMSVYISEFSSNSNWLLEKEIEMLTCRVGCRVQSILLLLFFLGRGQWGGENAFFDNINAQTTKKNRQTKENCWGGEWIRTGQKRILMHAGRAERSAHANSSSASTCFYINDPAGKVHIFFFFSKAKRKKWGGGIS